MALLRLVVLLVGIALPVAWAFVPSMPAHHVHFHSLSAACVCRRPGLQPKVIVAGATLASRHLRLQAEETPEGSSAGEEAGGTRRKQVMRKKRVRKDRPTGGRASSAEASEAPVPMDPRLKEAQEDIMRREFDRTIVLEEFAGPRVVDRTRPTPAEVAAALAAAAADEEGEDEDEENGEGEEEGKKEEDGTPGGKRRQFQGTAAEAAAAAVKEWTGVPENLRYDPTFELPIPSETVVSLSDIATKFDGAIETDAKALPTLAELGKKAKGSILRRQQEEEEKIAKEQQPIDDYDLSSAILGEGRPVLGIGLPYLQSCHTVVILVTLLCAFVEFPGFPLTNFPYELREFLKQGLVVIYLINAVLAWDSIKEAKKRDQSVFFWALKCFVLGALAHNELLFIREKPQASS